MMTFKEKKLYHQIHPLKLCVDISTGIFTTYLLWQHNILWFLMLFLLPSIIVSIVLIKFVDLEYLKNSGFGKYLEKYMTSMIEAIRIGGQIIMWIAGWYHILMLIIIGFFIIVSGWCNGLLFKRNK
jgi:hypothetical protein